MKLHELLQQHQSFDDKHFRDYYCRLDCLGFDNPNYYSRDEFVEEYKKVFETLKTLEHVDSDYTICINHHYHFDGENFYDYYDVSGSLIGVECNHDLALKTWKEWLGMEINQYTLEILTGPQIIVHCIAEMTFFGFEKDDNYITKKRLSEHKFDISED